jgi:hypothetical protein
LVLFFSKIVLSIHSLCFVSTYLESVPSISLQTIFKMKEGLIQGHIINMCQSQLSLQSFVIIQVHDLTTGFIEKTEGKHPYGRRSEAGPAQLTKGQEFCFSKHQKEKPACLQYSPLSRLTRIIRYCLE